MTALHPFRGLDLRAGAADASGYLAQAMNVIMDGEGRAVRRPALRFRGLLTPTSGTSSGLYVCGDQLRQAVVLDSGEAANMALFATYQERISAYNAAIIAHDTTGAPLVSEPPLWPGAIPEGFIGYYLPSWVELSSSTATGHLQYTATASIRFPGNPMMPTLSFDYLLGDADAPPEWLGAAADTAGKSVVLLRHSNGVTLMHRAPESGVFPTADTALSPGFTPAVALVRCAGRLWTMDANNRLLRFSALDDGSDVPPDFSSSDLSKGGGFYNVSLYAPGSGTPQALASLGKQVVVMYRTALLIYRTDEDQFQGYLDTSLVGPGTNAPRSIAEVGGDLLFLTDAGVRSLVEVQKSLGQSESSIFGKVDALAKALADQVGVVPVGHYARRMGAYLLAFRNEVLALPFIAGSDVLGWSYWKLPTWATVLGFAESQGQTFVRIRHTDGREGLWSLDNALDGDETMDGDVDDIAALVETLPVRSTAPLTARFVSASGTEPLQVQVVGDGRPALGTDGAPIGRPIVLPPRSPTPARASVSRRGMSLAVRVYDAAAKAGWRVDGLWLDYDKKG